MSSSELYLLYSLRGSPVPLGGRLELLSLGGGLDAAVVEWALEEAGPGLAFAPLVGAVEVVLGPCVFEPVVCCGLWLVGSSPPLVSPTSVKAGVFVPMHWFLMLRFGPPGTACSSSQEARSRQVSSFKLPPYL